MTTEIVPAGPPAEPPVPQAVDDPAAETVAAPPKKKRRGWLIALIVLSVLVVLGIIAFFVAEAYAKDYARDYVRTKLVEVLNLPADADMDVELGDGSIILQALAGRIQSVDVDVPDATFGELTGTLRLHAEGVPLEETAPVDVLSVDFAIDAADLTALGDSADDAAAPSFAVADEQISLTTEFSLFGVVIPIGVALEPSAVEGALVLTPTSLTIGEETFEAGSEDGSFFGQIASTFLQPQTLCIAGSVPQALVLAEATIVGPELVLSFQGDGAALGGPELSTLGTCPAA
jgi:hypothetical protein